PGPLDLIPLLQRTAAALPGGKTSWIADVIDPYVYLDAEGDAPAHRAALLAALEAHRPRGIARFYDTHALPAECPPIDDESLDAPVCRGVARGAGGAFYAALQAGSFFDTQNVKGHGTSHGSPWLYDRAVPLFARAPGRIAPALIDGPLPFATFTRTAASVLGI